MSRTVLVTGASSDIGLAVCRRYLEAGWRVIGHYRAWRPQMGDLASDRFDGWRCDFAETGQLEAAIEAEAERLAVADALVSLAAELTPMPFAQARTADYLRAIAVNVLPGLALMRRLGPAMAERGFGRIVHGASIGATFGGGSATAPYGFSKHAQEFIPCACRDWAARNVFVNVLRIGVTHTRIHANAGAKDMEARTARIPAGRMATTAEIAEALYWFGSDSNGYTTGQVVNVAGGE